MLVVERLILARPRNRRFKSLTAIDATVADLLVDRNNGAFKKLPACRRSCFRELDVPALQPLPAIRFEVARWKVDRVNVDNYVEFDLNYYSVPLSPLRVYV